MNAVKHCGALSTCTFFIVYLFTQTVQKQQTNID